MTAETTQKPPGEDRSLPPDESEPPGGFDLDRAVSHLLRPESVSKLDPYRKSVDGPARMEALKSLCKRRGRRYVPCTLDTFEVSPASADTVKALRSFVDSMPQRLSAGNGGLVLLGPPGTGKDHLLMGVMRDAIVRYGFAVEWYDGLRLFASIKAAIGSGSVEELLGRLTDVQILAISDPVPPRDALSAYELAVLRDVVERRYSRAMGTWITTNVQTAEDARRLFTDAVLSRLLHGATELFCDWPSYRKPSQ